jgi:hypothetical protein
VTGDALSLVVRPFDRGMAVVLLAAVVVTARVVLVQEDLLERGFTAS